MKTVLILRRHISKGDRVMRVCWLVFAGGGTKAWLWNQLGGKKKRSVLTVVRECCDIGEDQLRQFLVDKWYLSFSSVLSLRPIIVIELYRVLVSRISIKLLRGRVLVNSNTWSRQVSLVWYELTHLVAIKGVDITWSQLESDYSLSHSIKSTFYHIMEDPWPHREKSMVCINKRMPHGLVDWVSIRADKGRIHDFCLHRRHWERYSHLLMFEALGLQWFRLSWIEKSLST